MKNLFEYLKSSSFRDYWNTKNPNYQVPDIDKFECVRECYNDYIYTDGNYFYVLDSNDNCIEMHYNLNEIKTALKEKKTIIM